MTILDRYTLRAYLAPLFWCLTIFVGMYLIFDLLGHLDEILRLKVPGSILATYYMTLVPLVFVQVSPFACLMATLYTLSHFNRNQEIMAMRAAGIAPWSIVRPLIWMGLLLSAMVLLVNECVAPQAALLAHQIKEGRLERAPDPSKEHRVIKTIEHLAAYGQGHTILYANSFDVTGKKMDGLVILQHGPDLRLIRKIAADSAVWTGSAWRFSHGTILHFDKEGRTVGRPVPFEFKVIAVGERPEVLEKAESQASFMNSRDLYRYIDQLKIAGGRTIRKLRVELYAKPATAFACLVLTLIGIPFAIQPVRGGAALGLSLGLGIGLAFYGVNALLLALGKGGYLLPFLAAWAAPVGFAFFGIRKTWEKLA